MNKKKKYQEGYAQGYEDAVKTEMMYKEKEKQELLLGLVSVANKGQELIPHKDYEIKQDGEKFYLVKKKKKFPKTYEECLVITPYDKEERILYLLEKFKQLLICRNAYWKLAGDWKPEFRFGKKKYCIMTKDNRVITATVEETNRILAFPTEEMRDAFYENFKEEIEECKELL